MGTTCPRWHPKVQLLVFLVAVVDSTFLFCKISLFVLSLLLLHLLWQHDGGIWIGFDSSTVLPCIFCHHTCDWLFLHPQYVVECLGATMSCYSYLGMGHSPWLLEWSYFSVATTFVGFVGEEGRWLRDLLPPFLEVHNARVAMFLAIWGDVFRSLVITFVGGGPKGYSSTFESASWILPLKRKGSFPIILKIDGRTSQQMFTTRILTSHIFHYQMAYPNHQLSYRLRAPHDPSAPAPQAHEEAVAETGGIQLP